ncbi:helix-turn-helix domain-containing protein [Winogradskyella sp. 3972H.M.0a.05]|uniref:helix-turn-helix domain-containing protein n=1 Tax=Winogradskyella sp. 3972H.M.0a.05 TaxID=2950277 RepID=UPI00339B0432
MLNYSDSNFNKANKGGNFVITSSLRECHHKVDSSPISIKIPINGREAYTVNGKEHLITPDYFLLINKGDKVETLVDAQTPVDGKCIYLDENMVNKYYEEIQCKALFNDHDLKSVLQVNTGKYWLDNSAMSGLFKEIKRNPTEDDAMFYDKVAVNLVFHQIEVSKAIEKICSLSMATKVELYNRVNIAKTYILDNFSKDITLDELSQVACVSKFHLIRIFNDIHGRTPYNFLLKVRLDKAYDMLKNSKDFLIEEIAFMNGFKQRRTFTRLFKKEFGLCPNDVVKLKV